VCRRYAREEATPSAAAKRPKVRANLGYGPLAGDRRSASGEEMTWGAGDWTALDPTRPGTGNAEEGTGPQRLSGGPAHHGPGCGREAD